MICEENTSAEIGKSLNMGVRNVEGLRLKIMKKMRVKSSVGLAIWAVKNRLYTFRE